MASPTVKRGDAVLYIDADGSIHNALVLAAWPGNRCDMVIVPPEEEAPQLERLSDVWHKNDRPSAAFCWCWPAERPGG